MSDATLNRKRSMTISVELSGAYFWTSVCSHKTSFSEPVFRDEFDYDIYLCGGWSTEEL